MKKDKKIIINRIVSMLAQGLAILGKPYCQDAAAVITYFILLSLVPTVIIMTQLLSLVDISQVDMDKVIDGMMDPSMGNLLKSLLTAPLTAGNNLILAGTAIWAASKMQFSMQKVTNYIYTDGETTGTFIKERIRAIIITILTVMIFAVVTVILVNGPLIIQALFGNMLKGTTINKIWMQLRWPVTALLYLLLVLFNYLTLPNYKLDIQKLKARDVLPGSILAVTGMLLVTFFYSLYIKFANLSAIYGALASIVALMVWFYLISEVLIIGMIFNKVWTNTRDEDMSEPAFYNKMDTADSKGGKDE